VVGICKEDGRDEKDKVLTLRHPLGFCLSQRGDSFLARYLREIWGRIDGMA
jgi:hypothetical protein